MPDHGAFGRIMYRLAVKGTMHVITLSILVVSCLALTSTRKLAGFGQMRRVVRSRVDLVRQ